MTQNGRWSRVALPEAISSSQMIPMVFCASLLPCPRL
jgi:hypothetical protein